MTNGEKIQSMFPNINFGILAQDDVIVNKDYSNNTEPQVYIPMKWWNAEYKEPSSSEIPTSSDDCISRKSALEIYDEWFASCNIADRKASPKAKIRALPPMTPIKPKGYWIEHQHEAGANWEYSRYECSECHDWAEDDSDYCPYCGIEMNGIKSVKRF